MATFNINLSTQEDAMKKAATILMGILAALALSIFTAGGAHAEGRTIVTLQEDPASVARAFVDALNNHDPDAALELFAEDAVVTNSVNDTPVRYSTPDEIYEWLDAFPPAATLEIIGEPEVEGDRVTFVTRYRDEGLEGTELEYIDLTFTAVVQGGKIQTMVITLSPEEQARVDEAIRGSTGEDMPPGMPTGRSGGDESGGSMPTGMPTTGNGAAFPMLPLALLAMGLISTGLALSRRKA
jgi:hypothetical protein